jgi:predicted lipoprotein with Yx(FWY)xxD motif
MKRLIPLFALLPVLALAACGGASYGGGGSSTSSAAPAVLHVSSKANVGSILVDAQGRTLYRYAPDHGGGKSTCLGACAKPWPPATVEGSGPLTAAGVKGTVSTTTRPDGMKQLAFDGMPLYRFAQDTTKADANGQGVQNIWFVIPAKGAKSSGSTTTSTAKGRYSY